MRGQRGVILGKRLVSLLSALAFTMTHTAAMFGLQFWMFGICNHMQLQNYICLQIITCNYLQNYIAHGITSSGYAFIDPLDCKPVSSM